MNEKIKWVAILWPCVISVMLLGLSSPTIYGDWKWHAWFLENNQTILETMIISTLMTAVLLNIRGKREEVLAAASQPIIASIVLLIVKTEVAISTTIMAMAIIGIPVAIISIPLIKEELKKERAEKSKLGTQDEDSHAS